MRLLRWPAAAALLCLVCLLCPLCPAYAAYSSGQILSDGDRCTECALGNLGADALRAATGADVALFASGDLGESLAQGEISEAALRRSFPNNADITVVTLSAAELRSLIEAGLSTLTLAEDESLDRAAAANDGFFCVSGFTLVCNATNPAGSRVYSWSLAEDRSYTVAVSAAYAEGAVVGTLWDMLDSYIFSQETLAVPATNRIDIIGANENKIVGDVISKNYIYLIVGVILFFGVIRTLNPRTAEKDDYIESLRKSR